MSLRPSGFKISALLQGHMCRIGSKLPFDEASSELNAFWDIGSNSKQVERLCHTYGQQLEEKEGEEVLAGPGLFYCMVDGSMLLTREEKWKEIKLGRVFSAGNHVEGVSKGRGQIRGPQYCAHFGSSDAFWDKFMNIVPARGEQVFICDGAKWIWKYIDDFYPDNTQILDYFHCKEHVHAFALLWQERQRSRRFCGQSNGMLSVPVGRSRTGGNRTTSYREKGHLEGKRKAIELPEYQQETY